MTPKQLKAARKKLGLSAAGLAKALELESKWADRTVRKWEQPDGVVPGPVAVAVRGLLAGST
jgi:DNA-binding transcriptional regulator YiaG